MPDSPTFSEPFPALLAAPILLFESLFESPVLELDTPLDVDIFQKETLTAEADILENSQIVDEGNPETNEPFDGDLAKLRSYINHIEWGTKWFALSEKETVAEMAWCDNNVVLFAATVGNPTAVIIRPHKKPSASRTGAPKTRKAFSDEVIKDMPIPMLIDQYNHHVGAVDQFDQLRSYYDVLRSHRKTGRPLFFLLVEIVLVNSFKLSSLSDQAEASDQVIGGFD